MMFGETVAVYCEDHTEHTSEAEVEFSTDGQLASQTSTCFLL
jgi:hypothetical protein